MNNLLDDFEFMLGMQTGAFTRLCVAFVTPVLMIIVLVYSFAVMEPVVYNNQAFPAGAHGNITNTFTFLLEFNKQQSCGVESWNKLQYNLHVLNSKTKNLKFVKEYIICREV